MNDSFYVPPKFHSKLTRALALLALVGIVAIPSGCNRNQTAAPPGEDKLQEVKVATAEKRNDVITSKYFTGAVRESERVDIRARVQGYLDKIHFEDGGYVKENQLLFEIEPDQYEARLAGAQAALLSAKTAQAEAEQQFRRGVAAGTAISEEEREARRTRRDIAIAAVAEAEAAVKDAQINVDYTKIHSPLTGRIGRRLVDRGNLVGADGNTHLTTVVSRQPIQIYFEISGPLVDRVQRLQKDNSNLVVPVEAQLTEETDFPHKGKLDYLDFEVDSTTGTAMARAVFKNEKDLLFPGAFVRVRIPSPNPRTAVMVHEKAIGTNTQGRFVYIVIDKKDEQGNVIEKNVVATRQIRRGEMVGGMRIVTSGLTGGETYIVEGVQKVRPDVAVNPSPYDPAMAVETAPVTKTTVVAEPPPKTDQ